MLEYSCDDITLLIMEWSEISEVLNEEQVPFARQWLTEMSADPTYLKVDRLEQHREEHDFEEANRSRLASIWREWVRSKVWPEMTLIEKSCIVRRLAQAAIFIERMESSGVGESLFTPTGDLGEILEWLGTDYWHQQGIFLSESLSHLRSRDDEA